jgi:cytochrome c-type biogenesis protein CcmH/NrfG
MSEEKQSSKTQWTSVQVYVMSLACLLIGVSVGYLYRGSTSAPQTQAVSGPVGSQGQMSHGQLPTSGAAAGAQSMPSAEQMKQMADKKVAPLLEQLNDHPKDIETLKRVGTFYFAAHQFGESEKYYKRMADVKPTADALTNLSNAQFYNGEKDKAIGSLESALKSDPGYPDALYNLGMLEWKVRGNTQGALACWQKLIKLNPGHPGRAQVEKMIARVKEHEKLPAGTKTDVPAQ